MTSEVKKDKLWLRKIINFVVEKWFPNSMFYGNNYFSAFESLDKISKQERVTGYTAAMYLQSILRKHDATEISYEMIGVEDKGVPLGDYVLTLKRINYEQE